MAQSVPFKQINNVSQRHWHEYKPVKIITAYSRWVDVILCFCQNRISWIQGTVISFFMYIVDLAMALMITVECHGSSMDHTQAFFQSVASAHSLRHQVFKHKESDQWSVFRWSTTRPSAITCVVRVLSQFQISNSTFEIDMILMLIKFSFYFVKRSFNFQCIPVDPIQLLAPPLWMTTAATVNPLQWVSFWKVQSSDIFCIRNLKCVLKWTVCVWYMVIVKKNKRAHALWNLRGHSILLAIAKQPWAFTAWYQGCNTSTCYMLLKHFF